MRADRRCQPVPYPPAFPSGGWSGVERRADGAPNRLLFVEAGEPVPWTQPDEIPYDPTQPVRLRGLFRKGFRACSVDGRYQFIEYTMDQRVVHAIITRNGGESLPADW